MNKEFEKSLNYALRMDSLEEITRLFTSPSGFYIGNGKGGYAKIQSELEATEQDIKNLVSKFVIEYQLNETEFGYVKTVASGMGFGINKGGRLALIENLSDALKERGYQVYEIKSPDNRDISKLLHSCVVHHRQGLREQGVRQSDSPSSPRLS